MAEKDDDSVELWIERLKAQGAILAFKGSNSPVPDHAPREIEPDAFILVIQTDYQQECARQWGQNGFLGVDATHNTAHYEGVLLFTILLRDHYGHGKIVIISYSIHLY